MYVDFYSKGVLRCRNINDCSLLLLIILCVTDVPAAFRPCCSSVRVTVCFSYIFFMISLRTCEIQHGTHVQGRLVMVT